MGASNDRGGITFSAEYSDEDPVFGKDREFSKYGNSPDIPFDGWSLVSQNGVWLFDNCEPTILAVPTCTLNKGSDPRDPNNNHGMTNRSEKSRVGKEWVSKGRS